jgi:hypothetical protein
MEKHFYIDKITDCIEEVASRVSYNTEVLSVSKADLKQVSKSTGWDFPWKSFAKLPERSLYKLVICDDPDQTIQGLISLEIMEAERYIELHHIESAAHNYGKHKRYAGVAGNLVAFACKLSFEHQFEGFVAFKAKTALIEHYMLTLNAILLNPKQNRMAIFPESAQKLVNSYSKNR